MSQTYVAQLRAVQGDVEEVAIASRDGAIMSALAHTEGAANAVAASWSGSNLGFHSRVYYENFAVPPPGAHFSSEWGFLGAFQGTTGDWREMPADSVLGKIRDLSGVDDLDGAVAPLVASARRAFEDAQAAVQSILTAFLAFSDDEYIRALRDQVVALRTPREADLRRAFPARFGTIMSRDTGALGQGIQPAPHQQVLMKLEAHKSVFVACEDLARMTKRAADHIERLSVTPARGMERQRGTRVFIGHGRSPLWRELKDFVSDRLGLPYDEFNRVPVAGVTNIDRLSQMLDNAAVALLVLTAEDERADGATVARQNVVHESGLFQGRLGFSRAIILLEDGCEEFSNVNGLGQIRFAAGNISAVFEDIRRVLEREGMLT